MKNFIFNARTLVSFVFILSLLLFISCKSAKIQLTGCDHYSGWCNEIREISVKSWKYAQLSKNVYESDYKFKLTDYFEEIESFENTYIDFYSTLFLDKMNGDYVLVFRGTDSFKDFKTGNNPFRQIQNNYALIVFDYIVNKYNLRNITVTGHSLGGGMSIHTSLNRPNVIAYSFNGSPVFKKSAEFNNERYSIVENGEVLKLLRIFGREATQLYTSIGCSNGNPIKQHDMKSLAVCLTKIAAIEDEEAKMSLKNNDIEFEYKKDQY